MNKLTLKQKLGVTLAGFCVVLGSFFLGWANPQKETPKNLGVATNISLEPVALIGTQVGTTTTGVSFYARTASTTYPIRLNGENNIVFNIQSMATSGISTLGGFASFSILSSNTTQCDTASTTYSVPNNNVIVGDIKWADAGNHLKNATAVTSLSTGTTTIGFTNNGTGQGKELILTDVKSRCLALEVAASSTVLQVTVSAK